MKKTLQWILNADLKLTEMRFAISVMVQQLKGKKSVSPLELSEITGVDLNRARSVCRDLERDCILKKDTSSGNMRNNMYSIAYDEFNMELILCSEMNTSSVLKKEDIEQIQVDEPEEVLEETDNYVEYNSYDLDPYAETNKDYSDELEILRDASQRRKNLIEKDDRDPIKALEKARANRSKEIVEETRLFQRRDISPDNDYIIDGMRKKYKRVENIERRDVICILFAMKQVYPDVSAQNIGKIQQEFLDSMAKCIDIVGYDELLSIIRGRRIAFNGSNFSKYWTRQFKNIPKYISENKI